MYYNTSMNQTIYFRKDVWDKFKDELGKSNLVNQLLATHYNLNPREVTVDDRPIAKLYKPGLTKVPGGQVVVPNVPGVVRGADFVPKPPDPETGYPCCTKRSPCKHWQWDSNLTLWVNSLTGKTREG